MATIIIGLLLAVVIAASIAYMISNVKKGKSFCGADIGEKVSDKRCSENNISGRK